MRSDSTPGWCALSIEADCPVDSFGSNDSKGQKPRRRDNPTHSIEPPVEGQFVLRFVVPAREIDALTAAVRLEQAHERRCLATGFDTADGRLAACGVFLSLCKRGSEWLQIAVATTSDFARLLVHEVDIPAPRRGVTPMLMPQLHDDAEVGVIMRLALGNASSDMEDGQPLVETFAIDAKRLACRVCVDGAVVEIARVTGMITTADASMPLLEFEARLVSGPLAVLFKVAQAWSARHGMFLSAVTDGERGARLAGGHPDGYPAAAVLPRAPFADGTDFVRATLDSCLSQIVANAGAVVDGSQDRNVIHQLRNGLERLRTAIAALNRTGGLADTWEPVLKRIFQELAIHRGAPALRAPLIQEMRAAGLAYALGSSHPREMRGASAIVQDAEFQCTLLAILAYRHAPAPLFKPDHGTLQQMHKHFATELEARLDRLANGRGKPNSLGRRRRASRHLDHLYRFATFVSPLYETPKVESFLVRCRHAQDALTLAFEHGSGLEALEDDVEAGAGAKLARRWLKARLVDDSRACESLVRRVGKAVPFWVD